MANTIDMTAVLCDENGRQSPDWTEKEPVPPGYLDPDPTGAKLPKLTLGAAVAHALFASFDPQKDPAEQKWARAALAMRVRTDKAAVLTAEEVSVVKRQMGLMYGGVVLVQAFPLLDPNASPPQIG